MPSIKGDYHFNEKDQSLIRFVTFSNKWKKEGYRMPSYIVEEMMKNLNALKFVLVDRQELNQYSIEADVLRYNAKYIKGAKEEEISIGLKYFDKSDFIGRVPQKRIF